MKKEKSPTKESVLQDISLTIAYLNATTNLTFEEFSTAIQKKGQVTDYYDMQGTRTAGIGLARCGELILDPAIVPKKKKNTSSLQKPKSALLLELQHEHEMQLAQMKCETDMRMAQMNAYRDLRDPHHQMNFIREQHDAMLHTQKLMKQRVPEPAEFIKVPREKTFLQRLFRIDPGVILVRKTTNGKLDKSPTL